jgi:hypothetical protein
MNMSYCRFRNTLIALQDCRDEITDGMNEHGDYEEYLQTLDPEERRALKKLVDLASDLVEDHKHYKEDLEVSAEA